MARLQDCFPPHVRFGSRLLRVRRPLQRGTDVAILQILHNTLRTLLDRPYGLALAVDGAFGPATEAAVCALQRRFGLGPDGMVGPATYFTLGHGVGAHTTYGGPPFGSRVLAQGSAGGDVYVLQNRLALYRYAKSLGQPPSGTFGPQTTAALALFQADLDIGRNPAVDDTTANALLLYTQAGGRAIFGGRNGLDVAFVQRLLKARGYYRGIIDGRHSPAMMAAVRTFQQSSGLAVDGVVGPATFFALGLANPHPAPHPCAPPRF